MSGGHWEFKQWELTSLADAISQDIEKAGTVSEFGYKHPDDKHLVAGLKTAEKLIRASGDLVHHLDWCLSGDTGEDTLKKQLRDWLETNEATIKSLLKELKKETK